MSSDADVTADAAGAGAASGAAADDSDSTSPPGASRCAQRASRSRGRLGWSATSGRGRAARSRSTSSICAGVPWKPKRATRTVDVTKEQPLVLDTYYVIADGARDAAWCAAQAKQLRAPAAKKGD